MPTTGAVLYFRPTQQAVLSPGHKTGAVVSFAVRESTGLISANGIKASAQWRNRKALKPHRSVPPIGPDGLWTTDWDNFFQYLNDTFLKMPNGPTLPDVASSVTASQARSIAGEVVATALAQQANANAQALSAVVQVAQMAALPGAAQIPPVQLSPPYESSGAE